MALQKLSLALSKTKIDQANLKLGMANYKYWLKAKTYNNAYKAAANDNNGQ
ncbi:hypothetical protein [Psychrobacter phenylpyruvicus]|uniref:hypothetical protein n=1 Tax=Psychrobacter phenylpyruvicus TaxID=29432 RepID=UPI000B0E7264|nr:hypothetical protein [Psychrobacter phenylpyruvicus]